MSEKIGLVSISDRASGGIYEDKGIPALQDWLNKALTTPWVPVTPDRRRPADHRGDADRLCDVAGCHLVLTTGGTGPALRDVTPEATLAVAHKVMPGLASRCVR